MYTPSRSRHLLLSFVIAALLVLPAAAAVHWQPAVARSARSFDSPPTTTSGADPAYLLNHTLDGTTTTYSYDDADRLLSDGSTSYTYDAAGNLLSGGGTYTWDWADRLASATVSGTTTNYAYAADDVRASKTTGSTTTPYLWDREAGLPQLVDDGTQSYVQAGGVQEQDSHADTAGYVTPDRWNHIIEDRHGPFATPHQKSPNGIFRLTPSQILFDIGFTVNNPAVEFTLQPQGNCKVRLDLHSLVGGDRQDRQTSTIEVIMNLDGQTWTAYPAGSGQYY